MAESSTNEKPVKMNVFMRLGRSIKQIVDEMRKVVTPTRKQLFFWSLAVFIFVFLMMLLVMGLDGLFGDLVFRVFG